MVLLWAPPDDLESLKINRLLGCDLFSSFICRLYALPGRLLLDTLDIILFKLTSREWIDIWSIHQP